MTILPVSSPSVYARGNALLSLRVSGGFGHIPRSGIAREVFNYKFNSLKDLELFTFLHFSLLILVDCGFQYIYSKFQAYSHKGS